ncbi:acyltransferase [Pseudomonas sp. AOB-7]|uniref:acyltransferase family protein n=1 Tax=Pseudomonas sp. AOB-7 TaxID=2482750 RepID=UPI000EFD9893|nr:acyltransferase family protein [Pseudomonas sp. AOB-7]RMH84867.1 acyltransferase [Pseudomonas sp. AOB-7]
MKRHYRPDIDGIRAIAVMSVLLFHAGFASFSGGYVGVDVFFVISGFLITRLIKDEIEEGRFSFGEFYARRARRLFPALFVTVAATFLLAVLMFSPEHMRRFAGELIYAVTSLSNFYFWGESGYFDADAHFKPLLHTWSLSVEEQFYLFWPLLLVFLLTRLRGLSAALAILALGGISFALNLLFQGGGDVFKGVSSTLARAFADGGATIYFLTPFRIFEFAIGAVLVWLMGLRPRSNWPLELLLLVGLVLAIAPVFLYDETLLFPSYYALAPCLGAALLIYAGEARYLGRILRNPLSVRIGLISYSLYLVHWPVYVFYRYYVYGELTTVEKYGVLLTSFALALVLYHFVEQRYRKPKQRARKGSRVAFGLSCVLLALFLIVPAAMAWFGDGWAWRAERYVVQPNEIRCESPSLCKLQDGSRGRVLLVGDSHLGHHMKTLLEKFSGYQVDAFNVSACFFGEALRTQDHKVWRKKICARANANLRKYLHENGGELAYVVHAQRWHMQRVASLVTGKPLQGTVKQKYKFLLDDVMALYAAVPARKIVLGAAPNTALGCVERARFISMPCRDALLNDTVQRTRMFKNVAKQYEADAIFIHPVDSLCRGNVCRELSGNKKLYRDVHHLTREGSNLVLRKLQVEG